MTLEELQTLVNKGEGTTVEFKKTTAQLHAAFEIEKNIRDIE